MQGGLRETVQKWTMSQVDRRSSISLDIELTQIVQSRGMEIMPKVTKCYDEEPPILGREFLYAQVRQAVLNMVKYGGGYPAREKPHTSPARNFTVQFICGPLSGESGRHFDWVPKPSPTWRDGISRGPYRVSTAWA